MTTMWESVIALAGATAVVGGAIGAYLSLEDSRVEASGARYVADKNVEATRIQAQSAANRDRDRREHEVRLAELSLVEARIIANALRERRSPGPRAESSEHHGQYERPEPAATDAQDGTYVTPTRSAQPNPQLRGALRVTSRCYYAGQLRLIYEVDGNFVFANQDGNWWNWDANLSALPVKANNEPIYPTAPVVYYSLSTPDGSYLSPATGVFKLTDGTVMDVTEGHIVADQDGAYELIIDCPDRPIRMAEVTSRP